MRGYVKEKGQERKVNDEAVKGNSRKTDETTVTTYFFSLYIKKEGLIND